MADHNDHYVSSHTLQFRDPQSRMIASLRIAGSGGARIRLISEQDAFANGEAPVQLEEGRTYEFQLENLPPGVHLRDNPVLKRSGLHPNSGRIEPGNHNGLLSLELDNTAGLLIASLPLEVYTTKLGYREDYRNMLDDIGQKCADLLLDIRAPLQLRLLTQRQTDSATLQQRFAFVKSLIDSREFRTALQRIFAMPHRQLEEHTNEQDIRRVAKPDRRVAMQLASRHPRIPVPERHPLAAHLSVRTGAAPSLPQTVTTVRHRETVDIKENRFVKHTLEVYVDFLTQMERALQPQSRQSASYARLHGEVIRLREQLAAQLARPFFRDISKPDLLPLGSPVLQRKAGYRELLRAWIRFQLAAGLVWNGGADVFGAGKRDMAVLYEYWLFFELLELVKRRFRVESPGYEALFAYDAQGIRLRLRAGESLSVEGVWKQADGCSLRVRFSYNRTFSYTENFTRRGTWTRPMRPDFTLSFRPDAYDEQQAETCGRIAHVHFDAKYKADRTEELFGSQHMEDELTEERQEQRKGTYKRVDLLKMHAYHDAIRRTEGAFLLYPGHINTTFQEESGRLPAIGAFAIRPQGEGRSRGLEAVEHYLNQLLTQLSQRWSDTTQSVT